MNDFDAAARDLGLENDPLIRDVMRLLRASDRAHQDRVNNELARIGRMHAVLDRVPNREVE